MVTRITQLLPLGRTKKLWVEELDGELVVYDLARNKAHCLNPAAAIVSKRRARRA